MKITFLFELKKKTYNNNNNNRELNKENTFLFHILTSV